MKTLRTILSFLAFTFSVSAQSQNPGSSLGATYGQEITLKTPTPLKEVIEHIDQYDDKEVLMEGSITDVCQRKGCWLMLSDGKQSMRVTFKGYSFFVPKDSYNKKGVVQGVVKHATLSEAAARHYASEQKDRSGRPEDIKGPQKVVTMVASGVKIY